MTKNDDFAGFWPNGAIAIETAKQVKSTVDGVATEIRNGLY
jgi:hypothetical protein